MKTNIQFLITTLILFQYAVTANAQQALVACGGNAEGTNGTVSNTIGQTAFNYFVGTSGTVSQGVQQPYEIFLVTDTENAWDVTLDCLVYPNPVHESLQLKIEGLKWEKLHWGIYDQSGRLLKGDRVSQSLSTIPVDELVQGSYLFTIFDIKNSTIKTFKIIKN
jgi:hypothetical protein